MKNPLVSILIANYNNAEYIADCINSLNRQSYKNIEIIFFDDRSKDNSIKEITNFKEVKVIKNKEKTMTGSFNQMKAFKEAHKLSKGEIIFLLDSDDYFHKKKIEEVVSFFIKNKKIKILFDYPFLRNKKILTTVKKSKKNFFKKWPYIHPTSCISLKREIFEDIYKLVSIKKYPDIWIDFRICLCSKYILNNFYIINKNLTYYRQVKTSISSKFIYLGKKWWNRRMQAHNYLEYLLNKKKISHIQGIDYYLTKIFNFFIT